MKYHRKIIDCEYCFFEHAKKDEWFGELSQDTRIRRGVTGKKISGVCHDFGKNHEDLHKEELK